MILVIDNYDSFVENLARYCRELGKETLVKRNDAISIKEIQDLAPERIIISPGPCGPEEAGISLDVVETFGDQLPLLGVCLGHQCIAKALGMKVNPSGMPVHGKTAEIEHDNSVLFRNIPSGFHAARYHSLIVENGTVPDIVKITARANDNTIMAMQIAQAPLFGVQFHPESVLTEYGHKLMENFLNA